VNANSVAELIAYSRSLPQKLNYASAGIGSVAHLSFEVIKASTGMQAVHVPYKGGGPAMNDVIAGHVAMNMASIQVAKGLVEAGKIKGLAVTSTERSPVLRNVPTLTEAGVKTADVDLRFWFGIFAPTGVPDAVRAKLEKAVSATLSNPHVRERLAMLDIEPAYAPGKVLKGSSRARSRTGANSSTPTASSRNDVACSSCVMAGLVPAIHVFRASGKQDVDARQRRQVYAVCASLTACRA
jgi:tripartite-type tricarboxylate transporter receptor subunit TctC